MLLTSCPLCASARTPPLAGYEHAHLRRCRDCGFVFAGRRPSIDELRGYYDGYGLTDPRSEVTVQRYEELLDGFEPYRQTNSILDVGCGEGHFLEVAAGRGWTVHGTESTEGALERNRARGITMTLAPVRRGDLPARAFDVVTAFEVVEHLADPVGEAAILADVLREGGLLYVTTPNFDAASRRVLGPRWNVITYPEHLCYFTASTLTAWLRRAGFVRVGLATTGVSPRRLAQGLRSGRVAKADAEAAQPPAVSDEQVRAAIERSAALRAVKRVANAGLSALRAGDTLKGRFERYRP